MRSLLLLLALSAAILPAAQGQGLPHEYTATCSGSDTATGKACTIQLAASAARWVVLKGVFVQCSATCTVAQTRDGTAASATSVTIRKKNPNASWIASPVATVYSASNAGSGTAVGPTSIDVGASPQYLSLDLNGVILEAGAAAVQNYNITVTLTGTYVVTTVWEERPRFP